jgi:RNA polymerase sigma factor (sigma-70 family)
VKPFEQIVAEHGPTVLRVCRALLGPTDADDAWSETFLSALRAYPDLRPGANVEAWLVTIAHRKAIDLHRAAARRAVPVAELPESTPGQAGVDAWDGAAHAWDRAGLWAALRALPPKQRQTVAYHYLAGLPHREVAGIVGGSEAAARRAAADGIAALRRSYLHHRTDDDHTDHQERAPGKRARTERARR